MTARRLHRRLATTVGALIVVWLLSGIVMVLPGAWKALRGRAPAPAARPLDVSTIRVGLPEALQALERHLGGAVALAGAAIRADAAGTAWEFTLSGGERHRVRADDGTVVAIGPESARAAARRAAPGAGPVVAISLVTRRDFHYIGALPAYRVMFGDWLGTEVYVALGTGETQRITRIGRLHRWIASLHGFEPLDLVVAPGAARWALLLAASAAGLGLALTGFALVLSGRRAAAARSSGH